MATHSEDFGKDVVTLKGDDIFFLDTNIAFTYLYEKEKFHEATLLFIRYLLFKRVILCISEVVVMELLNVLARELYISHQTVLPEAKDTYYYRRRWGQYVIKKDPGKLSNYHRAASKFIKPFIDLCVVVESDEKQVRQAIDISIHTPLASADSLIISSALSVEANGVLSLDKDMDKVVEIPIYSTNIDNANFDGALLLNKLGEDFKTYLINEMGEEDFFNKYYSSNH